MPLLCRMAFLLGCMLLCGGCSLLPTRTVWLPDSSGVVSGNQYFDLATKQTHLLEFPDSFPEDDYRDVFVNAQTRSVIYTCLHTGDDPHLQLVKAPLPSMPGERTKARLAFAVSDTPQLDVVSSPDGKAIVICQIKTALIYHWETQKQIPLPDGIAGPYAFERVLGVSPCRPDGAGFLAMTAAKGKEVFDRTTSLRFVRWDGSVENLEGTEELSSAASMFHHIAGDGIGPAPFLGTAAWNGSTLTLACGGERLEIDTDGLRLRIFKDEERVKPRRADQGIDDAQKRIQADGRVSVPCGRIFIETKPHGPFRQTQGGHVTVCDEQLIIRDPGAGTEQVVDFHWAYPLSRFRLIPSPDGRHVIAHFLTARPDRKPYALLFNDRGEIVTVLGSTPGEWRLDLLNRRIGLPVDATHDAFGKGWSVRLHSTTFQGEFLDLLKTGDERFESVRKAAYLEVDEIDRAALGDALRVIGTFPALRFLYCSATDEAAEGLAGVPNLEGLTGPLTDRFLDRLPALEKLHVIDFHEHSRLGRQGALALRRHPTLYWLNLHGSSLTEPFLRGLAEVPDLRTIYVKDHIQSLKGLGRVSQLRRLSFCSVSLSEADLSEIGQLTRLERLDLRGVNDHVDSLETLRGLRSLKRLVFRRWTGYGKPKLPLPPLPLEPLSGMTELETLELSGVPVEDEDLLVLEKLKKLKTVSLRTPKCSEEALRRLSRALPETSISVLGVNERPPAQIIYRNGEPSAAGKAPPEEGDARHDC